MAPGSFGDGRPLVELHLPARALVVLVERDHAYIVPTGATRLSPGDHVLILADAAAFAAARDLLEVLDLDDRQPVDQEPIRPGRAQEGRHPPGPEE